MAFIPSSGSIAAWLQSDNASVITVGASNQSVSGTLNVVTGNSSVITVTQGSIATVIIGGSIAASFTPPANQSVSGTVGASLIGLSPVSVSNFPTTQNISGSVVSFINNTPAVSVQGTVFVSGSVVTVGTAAPNQSVSGTVQTDVRGSVATVIIGGSIAATFTPPANQSVSGAVSISNFPTNQNVSGSIVAFQGTNPFIITGSVQGSFSAGNSSVQVLNFPANQSISGTVGASIIGLTPVAVTNTPSVSGTVNVGNTVTVTSSIAGGIFPISGSVSAVVTNNVTVVSSIAGGIFPISGSVAATIVGTPNVNVAGSVVAFQGAGWSGSVAATITNTSLNVNGSVAAWLQSSNASVITVGTAAPNQSVSGTVQTDVRGSVATVIIGGSISATFTPPANQSVSGTIQTQVQGSVAVVIIGGSILTSSTANQSVSGTVGASIIGSVGVNQGAAASLLAGWPIINGEAGDVTGTFTNATQTTSVTANTLDGYGNSLISINGTYGTATAIFEGSDDSGVTWYTVSAARDDSNVIETGYTSLTNVSRTWQINNSGFDSLRVRSTAVASGTANIRISSSSAPNSSGATVAIGAALPAGTNAIGAVFASITGTVIASVSGSVGIVGNPSISGTVLITNTPSISGTVLVNNGSVVAFQGTSPWLETFSNSSIIAINAGSVVTLSSGSIITVFQSSSVITTWKDSSVLSAQQGTWRVSVAGTYATGAASVVSGLGLLGLGIRNDTLSSVFGTDGQYTPFTIGPVGEMVVAPAPIPRWVSGVASTFTGVEQPLITSVLGSRINVTGIQIANASANNVYLSFYGAGIGSVTGSIIGYTVAPANGGSNINFPIPLQTAINGGFSASVSGVASVFLSAQGFTSKT